MNIKLIQCSDNELVVSNAILQLANSCASNQAVANICIQHAKPLLARQSTVNKNRQHLNRLFASCTCFSKIDFTHVSEQIAHFFLENIHLEPLTAQFAILGLGNLTADYTQAREVVFNSQAFQHLLEIEPKTDSLYALLANVSASHTSTQLAHAVLTQAPFNSNAAFTLANCSPQTIKVPKDLVDEMMQSKDQAIQESGLDILSSCATIGPTPALCWMTEHIHSDIKRKARAQVNRFVDQDLLGMIERGCIPVLWQLALANRNDFASQVIQSIRKRLTPTVHQVLLRTLRMEGNTRLRGHVATALVHLAPDVIKDEQALQPIIEMLDHQEGRGPAMDFFQAIHANLVLQCDKDIRDEDIHVDQFSPQEIINILDTPNAKHSNYAFAQLLDQFDTVYNSTKSKHSIHRALVSICQRALD